LKYIKNQESSYPVEDQSIKDRFIHPEVQIMFPNVNETSFLNYLFKSKLFVDLDLDLNSIPSLTSFKKLIAPKYSLEDL